jgi:hypothetical protein
MHKLKLVASVIVIAQVIFGCDTVVKSIPGTATQPANGLTNEEVIRGLREALVIGTNKSTEIAGATNGFYKNPKLFIPWPEEAKEMRSNLVSLGYTKQVEEFEMSLNRAAEDAATRATPVFTAAIANMSIRDGFAILRGNDTAATSYLRRTTYAPLYDQFQPVVKDAIEKVSVTKYWSHLANAYNYVPGVKKVDPDLDNYVTNKAINGLMLLIAEEEARIRKDPLARVTDLLKKVFGSKGS